VAVTGAQARTGAGRVLPILMGTQVPALLMPDGFCTTGLPIVLMIIASIAERRWIGSQPSALVERVQRLHRFVIQAVAQQLATAR
jgi:hypothetical protein